MSARFGSCPVLGCECACHRAKRRQVPRLWTPDMDARVRAELAAGATVGGIASRLHLTLDSVRWRIRQLGLSTRWTRVADDDLRAFVGAHAGALFDPSGVADPSLRSLAETAAVANRRRATA